MRQNLCCRASTTDQISACSAISNASSSSMSRLSTFFVARILTLGNLRQRVQRRSSEPISSAHPALLGDSIGPRRAEWQQRKLLQCLVCCLHRLNPRAKSGRSNHWFDGPGIQLVVLPRITVDWLDKVPPFPCAKAVSQPGTCLTPHSPRSCRTASINTKMPYIPGWP